MRLNPPAGSQRGEVQGFALSSDSESVVFDATVVGGRNNLFSVPVAGGTPVQLDPAFQNGRARNLALSPDGRWVVYLATHLSPRDELFAVPIDGSASPLRLHPPVPPGGSVEEFLISPDSQQVVFRGDPLVSDAVSLFTVPIAGGANSPLTAPPLAPFSLRAITPGGARVLFSAPDGLFSVPLAGGPVAEIHDQTGTPLLTPDGRRVLFQDTSRVLRSALVDGSAPSVALLTATRFGGLPLYTSPDGLRVFLEDGLEHADSPELFRISITGGRLAKLNVPLEPTGAPRGSVAWYQLTPDQKSALYAADQEVFGRRGLYEVHADASSGPVRLDGATGSVLDFQLTRDGRRLVFLQRTGSSPQSSTELHSRPIGGGPIVRLDSPASPAGGASSFALDPSSRRVAYLADEDGDGRRELRGIPVAGGASVLWSGVLAPGAQVPSFSFTPDGERILYLADEDVADGVELFSRATSAPGVVRLNLPLGPGERVESFQVSPDGARAVFIEIRGGGRNLMSVPPAGGAPVRFTLPGGVALHPYFVLRLGFSGARAVFLASRGTSFFSNELFSAPISGGDALRLSQDLPTNDQIIDFELSPDGGRVLFRLSEASRLFSVSVLGGPVAPIAPTLFAQEGYAFTSDGSRALFVAFDTVPPRVHLFSAPVAGGAETRLSGALGVHFPIPEFSPSKVSTAGAWAGFVAGNAQLYAVRTDGQGGPQLVNESTSAVEPTSFLFGRERIFYRGSEEGFFFGFGSFELFSRPYSTLAPARPAR